MSQDTGWFGHTSAWQRHHVVDSAPGHPVDLEGHWHHMYDEPFQETDVMCVRHTVFLVLMSVFYYRLFRPTPLNNVIGITTGEGPNSGIHNSCTFMFYSFSSSPYVCYAFAVNTLIGGYIVRLKV